MIKEEFEWIHSWCDEAEKTDKPRIVLIGDSITYGYQEKVRELLKNICYVDYIACSYSINMKFYHSLIFNFIYDSNYEVIHFNNGLHGIEISSDEYEKELNVVLDKINIDDSIIIATCTLVNEYGNEEPHKEWMKKVTERNGVIKKIARERTLKLDDLFASSEDLSKEDRKEDGFHYSENGYEKFAQTVAKSIEEKLNERKFK